MNLDFVSASRVSRQARLFLAVGAVAAGLASQSALAQTYLGTNQPFAVMGATAVTCVVSSAVSGDLGISPNGAASITGYPVDAERVRCPMLVVAAEDDLFIPPNIVKRIAARYGATLRVMENRGHMVIVEPGWEKLAADVEHWIREHT